MSDSDNPLGGIMGMVVMIAVLPMILQMLQGLTGGGGQQNGVGGGLIPLQGGKFAVAQPTRFGNYNYVPGREYSTGNGQFQTPIDLSGLPRVPGGPAVGFPNLWDTFGNRG